MGNYYIQEIERLPRDYESTDKVALISYSGTGISLRSFKSMKELNKFAIQLGFSYQLSVSTPSDQCGTVKCYDISHIISDIPNRYFWDLKELPPEIQLQPATHKITLTENGQDVTCYFINDEETIHIFRPNCNAKNVYKIY